MMNRTLDGIASTAPRMRPVLWNVAKIQAAACILASACISIGLVTWAMFALL
jgi:hypothetical protein